MQKTKIPRLASARGLFGILEEALEVWEKAPDEQGEKDFLFLCFGLAHLGEWIVGSGELNLFCAINAKDAAARSPAENFYFELWGVHEFQLLRGICDASKHFKLMRPEREPETSIATGAAFEADLEMSFTSTPQIGDRDAIDVFRVVLSHYRRWFSEHDLDGNAG